MLRGSSRGQLRYVHTRIDTESSRTPCLWLLGSSGLAASVRARVRVRSLGSVSNSGGQQNPQFLGVQAGALHLVAGISNSLLKQTRLYLCVLSPQRSCAFSRSSRYWRDVQLWVTRASTVEPVRCLLGCETSGGSRAARGQRGQACRSFCGPHLRAAQCARMRPSHARRCLTGFVPWTCVWQGAPTMPLSKPRATVLRCL